MTFFLHNIIACCIDKSLKTSDALQVNILFGRMVVLGKVIQEQHYNSMFFLTLSKLAYL
jgi:hypothetical protein